MSKKHKAPETHRNVFQVVRERAAGDRGKPREPLVEEFGGLDRARLAALGYALDSFSVKGDCFTGIVRVRRQLLYGDRLLAEEEIDVIDERVAFRVLHEMRLPTPKQLSVAAERFVEEESRLDRFGI